MYTKIAAISAFIAAASAQQACSSTAEKHPALNWQKCATGGSCSDVAASVVLDSNWRWTHTVGGNNANCYDGNTWDKTICPNGQTCASACCVDGAEYSQTYGITTSGNSLNLKFVTDHQYGKNVGSRVYLMEPGSETAYQMFNLLNNEFTFDVDVSNLPCGLNGALYFVSMDKDGGASKFSGNKAGAKYGTGYCDSQCPRDVKFIGGKANVEGWDGSDNNGNAGVGNAGACCAEMDIWEANSISTAYTPHPCSTNEYHVCNGDSCGGTYSSDRYGGTCDPDGCDFNSYRQGNRTFYGPGTGFTVNTNQKVTVVTQFLTNSAGTLTEIKRFYVQNGKVIPNSVSTVGPGGNSLTQSWCDAQKSLFDDIDVFKRHGGMAKMGEALKSMVLVLSLWDDYYANMLWLDATYPIGSTKPGAARGTCSADSGKPADVEKNHPNANVVFSNIKFGPIGSTFNSGGGQNPPPSTTTTTTTSRAAQPTAVAPIYGQCGGRNWNGPTVCAAGSCCRANGEWYSQCIPGSC